MEASPGSIYTCSLDDLKSVPEDVQRAMFSEGRLRVARYDGGGKWHVFTDEEMRLYEYERMKGEAPKLIEDTETELPKLDLGCGLDPKKGFEGVDLYSPAPHKVDLLKFPWPWADESVGELVSSHFIEHIPAREVGPGDLSAEPHRGLTDFLGQDMLFAFMDECWRVLRPAGTLLLVFPCARSDGAFQDPTHRRYLNQNTLRYFTEEGREHYRVSHYKVKCNFQLLQLTPAGLVELTLMHPLVQARRMNGEWNVVLEFQQQMRKIPITT